MLTVGAAVPSDARAIQDIFQANMASAEWLLEKARVTDFAKSSEGEHVYVASLPDGTVAGFVSVYVEDSFVHHLHVHSGLRNKGVGRLLLRSLQNWLPAPWRLKCVRKNRGALDFYLRNDWREVGCGESEDGAYAVLEWRGKFSAS
ncbi:GNAT family N-acetyltransferase [Herbaspirillum autotrophicum]|uniref:GNAT family N-acetyltransferase n=1 Tax=Herbaspirillum autotrophicum TaxID=180195 RepID=UPI00067E5835|nr:GNAT family N-acetyltransferase [Herbaspirillum autotrophicum]